MTATPTPLRDTIGHMRDIADVAERYTVEELRDVLREKADELEATLSARDAAGAVELPCAACNGSGEVLGLHQPGLDPQDAYEVMIACPECEGTAIATPPASGEADPQNWPQWVKDAVRNANEAGRHAGRAEATPSAASGDGRSPSYDALLIIVQSVCGALKRAGFDDCDDPGEAIDVMREGYERRLAAVAPAGMEAVFTADEVAEAMEVLRGRHGSTALIGEVLDDMERVLLAAAPTPPATAGKE